MAFSPMETAAQVSDAAARLRAEIAAWYPAAERDVVHRRLQAAALAVPERLRGEVCIGIVQRTAGALELLDAVLADAQRNWRGYLAG